MTQFTITELSRSYNSYGRVSALQIDGDRVVWTAYDSTNKKQIFLYNGEETIQLSSKSSIDNSSARTDGKKIIWQSKLSSRDSEIFIHNSKKTTQLTRLLNPIFEVDLNNYKPRILGENIVWKSEGDLFLYNGEETIQLNDPDIKSSELQISGENVV